MGVGGNIYIRGIVSWKFGNVCAAGDDGRSNGIVANGCKCGRWPRKIGSVGGEAEVALKLEDVVGDVILTTCLTIFFGVRRMRGKNRVRLESRRR